MILLTNTYENSRVEARKIWIPRLSRPEVVRPGEEFQVLITDCDNSLTAMVITGKTESRQLKIRECKQNQDPDFTLTARLPGNLKPGLYDLSLYQQDRIVAFEPHCLWVCETDAESFLCAHISDMHIYSGGKSEPLDRTAVIDNLMRFLAHEVKPDFIINTGDLITRYDGKKRLLPAEHVYSQIITVKNILLKYRIPHFITPGNHDMARPLIRRDWLQVIGGPRNSDRDDYSFTCGGVKFIGLDRSLSYDNEHKCIDLHMPASQHRWLQHELDSLTPGQRAVIFCHYDYRRELYPYLRKYRIYKVLYGHSDKRCFEQELAEFDGGLRKPYAYQLLEQNSKGLKIKSVQR